MIEKRHIETILKVNGLPPTAPEEQIRSILISSRYDNDEIDTAIMVLKENTQTKVSHVDGLHKVFRTDKGLKPSEISQLLGIDVVVRPESIKQDVAITSSLAYHFIIWTVSLITAIIAITIYMYIADIGLFHHTSAYRFPG